MSRIYTLITPEGREVVIGKFVNEAGAKRSVEKTYPADWLGLCAHPLEQREPRPDEKVTRGDRWTG